MNKNAIYRVFQSVASRIAQSSLAPLLGGHGKLLSDRIDSYVRRCLFAAVADRQVINGFEITFPTDGYFAVELASGQYEPLTTGILSEVLHPDMNFVDVGAHVGYYSLTVAQLNGNGHIYSFEPDPQSFTYLKENIQLNHLETRITATQSVVTDQEEEVTLFLGRRDRMTNSIFDNDGVGDKGVRCYSTTLDAFFAALGWPPIHLIKIDVEGAEFAVLRGMSQLSQRNVFLIAIIEFSPTNLVAAGVGISDFFLLLTELGFRHIYAIAEELFPVSMPEDFAKLESLAGPAFVNLLCTKTGNEIWGLS